MIKTSCSVLFCCYFIIPKTLHLLWNQPPNYVSISFESQRDALAWTPKTLKKHNMFFFVKNNIEQLVKLEQNIALLPPYSIQGNSFLFCTDRLVKYFEIGHIVCCQQTVWCILVHIFSTGTLLGPSICPVCPHATRRDFSSYSRIVPWFHAVHLRTHRHRRYLATQSVEVKF